MNEQLTVKNFGPIKDATVDFKRVTVFIGPTGGGKSTLAKLAAIFRDVEFYAKFSEDRISIFNRYAIAKYFYDSTSFKWSDSDKTFESDKNLNFSYSLESLNKRLEEIYSDNKYSKLEIKLADILFQHLIEEENRFSLSNSGSLPDRLFELHPKASTKSLEIVGRFSKAYKQSNPVYVPAERAFIAAIDDSLAGLVRDDIGVPKLLLNFINKYSIARRNISNLKIDFLSKEFTHKDNKDYIKIDDFTTLPLYETASGIQSVVPIIITLIYLANSIERPQNFIIEEPELNLYPTAQQGLMNWLVDKCTKGENDLTITTHSPYLLAHLNLLLYAYQVAENHPDRADDVAKIVPRESWINPKEFACYHVEGQKDNGVHSIVNPETGLISYNMLDAIAGMETTEFEKLLDINAGLEVE